jgi:ADP-ribose pyrophosphatase YjhB (NUDIX family)
LPGFLPESTWKIMLASMPIPCIDVICVNRKQEILYGWRVIPPYKNVWALIGGRIFKGEKPTDAARRNLKTHGIEADKLILNGVFSVNFKWRYDISISYVATNSTEPTNLGSEFSKFDWRSDIPDRIGGMYRRMIENYKTGLQ